MTDTLKPTKPLEKIGIDRETWLKNMPRRLSQAEKQDILSVVPNLLSAAEEVGTYNRLSMLTTLMEQISEIVVTPLAIPDFKEEVSRQFNEALIKPGMVVGVTAAEALGQPITQMALNSFHQSGSSKNVTYGIDRIRELINASKELKNNSCSIFFQDQNMSVDDIIMKVRPDITEINVSDLVKGIPDIETAVQMEEPWWYGPYRMLIRNDFQANSILRLKINVNTLYSYKVNMEDICRAIEHDGSVICVYSPMNIGEIHIYPLEKAVVRAIKSEGVVDKNNASMVFLWNCVIPALDKLKISGTTGIRQIYPVEAPVLQIIKDEQKYPMDPKTRADLEATGINPDRAWFVILNEVRMKITGITPEKLTVLATTAGMKVFKVRPKYVALEIPAGLEGSPQEILNRMIQADKKAEKKYEEAKRKEGARVIRRPPTDIMKASNLVYADSDGSVFKSGKSTLRTLLADPNIDSTRTFCNNVHEINAVLGIEAARSFLIKEFSDVIGYEGAYINPRHIVLLVDFMVSLGQVNGITFTGISRQPIGALEKASFQNAMDTFKEAAGFGEKKEVKGTSASIYVGKKAQIGTGFSENFMDASKYRNLEEEIELDPDMKLDIGDFRDAVGGLGGLGTGDEFMMMEGAEEEMFGGDGIGMFGTTQPGEPTLTPAFPLMGAPLIAPELTVAANKFNEAPCLTPVRPITNIEDVVPPPIVQAIPTAGMAMAGLPVGLMKDMEQFKVPVTPVPVTPVPVTPVPVTPVPATQPTVPVTPVPATQPTGPTRKKKTFDLEDFMG